MFSSMVFPAILAASGALATETVRAAWDLDFISMNASLPKVVVFGPLSATLLSASNWSGIDNINYGSGRGPTIPELIGNMSEVLSVAQIAYTNIVTSGGSSSMNSSVFLNVTQFANRQLCAEGSDIAGAIMIHGTNTLEETAFGVDLTLNCSKPFIATGAMRPDTYISPDGRANFYQAVAAAVSPESRDRGGMIAFNDRLTSIFYSTKLDANKPDTFKSLEQGTLGAFLAGQPYYYFGPTYPTGRPYFNVTDTKVLPSVIIIYGHQGADASLLTAAVANGAKGLILMGPGAASLPGTFTTVGNALVNQGIPVIAVPRPVTGSGSPPLNPSPIIRASFMQAPQARIMLQLAINANYTMDEIRDLFEGPLRRAVLDNWANKKFYHLS